MRCVRQCPHRQPLACQVPTCTKKDGEERNYAGSAHLHRKENEAENYAGNSSANLHQTEKEKNIINYAGRENHSPY